MIYKFSEDGVEARGGGQVLGAGGEHHRAADRPQSGHGDGDEDVYGGNDDDNVMPSSSEDNLEQT